MTDPAKQLRAFLSHSTADNEWCRAFANELQSAGWDVWYDETGLGGGAKWVETIFSEVQARDIFLVVLSSDAWGSRWVHEEVNFALTTNRYIVPVLHKPTRVEDILLTRQWVDVLGLPGADAALRVVNSLDQLMAPHAPGLNSELTETTSPPLKDLLEALQSVGGHYQATTENGTALVPPLCAVPEGYFLMGSRWDKNAFDREKPQRRTFLPAYEIAKYPVTVAEYAVAAAAGVVRRPPAVQNVSWESQLSHLDHPVVCISWDDAYTYASWLSRITAAPWRLPTEAEWEKAARGERGSMYPWGNKWDRSRANTIDGGPGTTTPVVRYELMGASQYGVVDMAGNVFEWCSTQYKDYPYVAGDGREWTSQPADRVTRGGSWFREPQFARCAFRVHFPQHDITSARGFRLVCCKQWWLQE